MNAWVNLQGLRAEDALAPPLRGHCLPDLLSHTRRNLAHLIRTANMRER